MPELNNINNSSSNNNKSGGKVENSRKILTRLYLSRQLLGENGGKKLGINWGKLLLSPKEVENLGKNWFYPQRFSQENTHYFHNLYTVYPQVIHI